MRYKLGKKRVVGTKGMDDRSYDINGRLHKIDTFVNSYRFIYYEGLLDKIYFDDCKYWKVEYDEYGKIYKLTPTHDVKVTIRLSYIEDGIDDHISIRYSNGNYYKIVDCECFISSVDSRFNMVEINVLNYGTIDPVVMFLI